MRYLLIVFVLAITFAACKKAENPNPSTSIIKMADDSLAANKFSSAIPLYEQVIRESKIQDSVSYSLFNLATAYQNVEDYNNLSKKDALEKAVSFYKEYVDKNPKGDKTAKALFAMGFIQVNQINKIAEGTENYRRLVKEFPNDKLAKDAQLELNNAGKTPEQQLMEAQKNSKKK